MAQRTSPSSPTRNQREETPEPPVSSQRHCSDSPDLASLGASDMHSMEETVDEFEATWGEAGNFLENQGRTGSVGDSRYSGVPSEDVGLGKDSASGGQSVTWRGCGLDPELAVASLEEEGTLEEELSKEAGSSGDEISREIANSEDGEQGGRQSSEVKVRGAGDVEEGEVSDSSDEMRKAGLKLGSQLGSQDSQVHATYITTDVHWVLL